MRAPPPRWVTRGTTQGLLYSYIERPMPWIEPEYLDCSVYLYPSEAEAEDGKRIGGSGFLLSLAVDVDYERRIAHQLAFVVSNKHVVEPGNKVVRVNTKDGRSTPVPLDGAKWYSHPTSDVALCPIGLDIEHKFSCVSTTAILTEKTIGQFDIGPGDDVFMVGRFVNHEGTQRNTPSLRFGNIAQMPFEPITADGLPPQESFLVEAKSLPGYSGSPVFVYLPPQPDLSQYPMLQEAVAKGDAQFSGINPKRVAINLRAGPWLLGVDWCHLRTLEKVWSRQTGKPVSPEWYVKSNTGMSGVVPAWKILDILEGDEMKAEIEKAKSHVRQLKTDAVADLDLASEDSVQAVPEADNPQGKEDFMRLLGAAATKRQPT